MTHCKQYFENFVLCNICVYKRKNNNNNKRIKWSVYKFSVDYNIIDTSNIINIHKYLMKKHDIS